MHSCLLVFTWFLNQDTQNSAFLEDMGFPPVVNERAGTSQDRDLVGELDRRMKRHVDNVLHAVDGLSERITRLQGRIIRVEGSVDYLKESVEYNNGKSDGKLRELENILREVVFRLTLLSFGCSWFCYRTYIVKFRNELCAKFVIVA